MGYLFGSGIMQLLCMEVLQINCFPCWAFVLVDIGAQLLGILKSWMDSLVLMHLCYEFAYTGLKDFK